MGAQGAIALRITDRARALGFGDSESLQNVVTTKLPNGTMCWAADVETMYVLDLSATAGGSNITPVSGPGFWTPLSGGSGGGIPMPDGTVGTPRGANFLSEPSLGIFRPAAGKIGVVSGNFLGLTMGNGLATNVDPLSPSVVRYVVQGFNRPLTGAENETTFAYVLIDPSIGDPQQAALYVDITGNQLDTFGPAIKIVHAGHGDAIYVAQFANGSAYEAASFADGTRGYISTIQVPNTPNSTLFNALWDSASVPNFGLFYADLSTANALTIRKRAATAVAGLTQIRLIEEVGGRMRFGVYNDGAEEQRSLAATAGVPLVESPEHRFFSSAWDGAAAQDNEWLIKVVPASTTASVLRFYQITTAGTVLVAQLSNDGGAPGSNVIDLQGGTLANVANVQSAGDLGLYTAGNHAIGLTVPAVNDDTTIGVLLIKQGGVLVAKAVTQGGVGSGGVGFRALVVPN